MGSSVNNTVKSSFTILDPETAQKEQKPTENRPHWETLPLPCALFLLFHMCVCESVFQCKTLHCYYVVLWVLSDVTFIQFLCTIKTKSLFCSETSRLFLLMPTVISVLLKKPQRKILLLFQAQETWCSSQLCHLTFMFCWNWLHLW